MATQPTSDDYAAQLAALYVLAEQHLLGGATGILRRTPATLTGQLSALHLLRRLVARVLGPLGAHTEPLVSNMVAASAAEGQRNARQTVGTALERITGVHGGGGNVPPHSGGLALPDQPFDFTIPHGERAAQAIRDDVVSSLDDVRFRITRWPDDIYKAIAPHGAIYQVRDNPVTPAQAQAMAWRVFSSQGVNGFTDKSGRDWSMSAYTEMAVRTASARAYNDSHMQTMRAIGVRFFTVPDDGHPCPLCFPWQGAILTDGFNRDPDIHTDGTTAEATAAGLFHPNCRHSLLPYFPGITTRPERQPWTDEMDEKYRATQRQRGIERDIRAAKRRLEYAVDPDTKAAAVRDIQQAQARMRQFVKATGLLRRSRREQLDLTDQYMKLPILPR